ncbi:MAG: hypothetical protein V4486_02440 [Patescibacteria group bacterium]
MNRLAFVVVVAVVFLAGVAAGKATSPVENDLALRQAESREAMLMLAFVELKVENMAMEEQLQSWKDAAAPLNTMYFTEAAYVDMGLHEYFEKFYPDMVMNAVKLRKLTHPCQVDPRRWGCSWYGKNYVPVYVEIQRPFSISMSLAGHMDSPRK